MNTQPPGQVDPMFMDRFVRDERGTLFRLTGKFVLGPNHSPKRRKYLAYRPADDKDAKGYWLDVRRMRLQIEMVCADCGYSMTVDEDNPDYLCRGCRHKTTSSA